MNTSKIQCKVKSGNLEVNVPHEISNNVLYALKGFFAGGKLTILDEATLRFRASQFVADVFLDDPKVFLEFCNNKFHGDKRNILAYEMFLTQVIEKAKENLKNWSLQRNC